METGQPRTPLECLEIDGRQVERGGRVFTKRLFFAAVWGSIVAERYGAESGYEGRSRALELRRARRRWSCGDCGKPIERGDLHGSSPFGHYCPDCLSAEEPAPEFRRAWAS